MRRTTLAWMAGTLGAGLTASMVLAQQFPPTGGTPRAGSALSASATGTESSALYGMTATRGPRYLLRNGLDYLGYQQYERALKFLREAEALDQEMQDSEKAAPRSGIGQGSRARTSGGLSPAERTTLKQGIERAQNGLRAAADAESPYALSERSHRRSGFTAARSETVIAAKPGRPSRPDAPNRLNPRDLAEGEAESPGEPIRLASAESARGASSSPIEPPHSAQEEARPPGLGSSARGMPASPDPEFPPSAPEGNSGPGPRIPRLTEVPAADDSERGSSLASDPGPSTTDRDPSMAGLATAQPGLDIIPELVSPEIPFDQPGELGPAPPTRPEIAAGGRPEGGTSSAASPASRPSAPIPLETPVSTTGAATAEAAPTRAAAAVGPDGSAERAVSGDLTRPEDPAIVQPRPTDDRPPTPPVSSPPVSVSEFKASMTAAATITPEPLPPPGADELPPLPSDLSQHSVVADPAASNRPVDSRSLPPSAAAATAVPGDLDPPTVDDRTLPPLPDGNPVAPAPGTGPAMAGESITPPAAPATESGVPTTTESSGAGEIGPAPRDDPAAAATPGGSERSVPTASQSAPGDDGATGSAVRDPRPSQPQPGVTDPATAQPPLAPAATSEADPTAVGSQPSLPLHAGGGAVEERAPSGPALPGTQHRPEPAPGSEPPHDGPDRQPLAPRPAAAPAPAPVAARRIRPSADSDLFLPEGPTPVSTLNSRLQRHVEEVARRQEQEDLLRIQSQNRPQPPDLPRDTTSSALQTQTQLDISRAPSPAEARPIKAIPVPDDWVPLAARSWTPQRKYWAAAASCHLPLYFQDPVLERYGHPVEQFVGPIGRYLSYPVDDPKESTQRNQILQPFFSAGLFSLQIIAWPYNLIMDPPWEAQYDLGYYRPGDMVPTDLYWLPLHGYGPPLRGNRY